MNKLLLKLAVMMVALALLPSNPLFAQVVPPAPRAKVVKITEGPTPERADDYLTIITWTSNNPGGSPNRLGVVHYGTDAKNLNQTAKSPLVLNQAHPTSVFRVRIQRLKPDTTYYYTVDSEEEGTGRSDQVKSPVAQFTTTRIAR
jgi:phosphodiesterase/alkaline phosphatase D-like protein